MRVKVGLEGWKGEDKIQIFESVEDSGLVDEWIVVEHRKDKKTGEVEESSHRIPQANVARMAQIISMLRVEGHIKIYARQVWTKLRDDYGICEGQSLDSFNGGHNRSKCYFPHYYYPVKILEALEIIAYGGNGVILLKNPINLWRVKNGSIRLC